MDTLCGLEFKLSVPSFYQVNRDQAEVLYHKALEFAGLTGQETVLDLYCGTGTITLCMAGSAARVLGAEIVPAAIDDARENAVRNHIDNAEFFCADAADIAAKLEREGLRPDVITVDPPRKGLSEEVVAPPGGVCLLRPGHAGPGHQALCRTWLPGCPGLRRGHVPGHLPCGDRGASGAGGGIG